MGIKPVLQALVLADHVYIDSASGKKVIAGTFNHLSANDFPSQFSSSKFAFISMTDVYGRIEIVLRYVDLSNNETLVELRNFEVESQDPLDTVELVIEIPPLPMPHAGVFAFEVHAGQEMLGFLRLFVTKRRSPDREELNDLDD